MKFHVKFHTNSQCPLRTQVKTENELRLEIEMLRKEVARELEELKAEREKVR
jgi:hypothetical protein